MKLLEPKPGVFSNIPAEDYHAGPGVSSTWLRKIVSTTPAHVRYELDNPDEEVKDFFEVGDAVHTGLLEPDEFDKRVCVAPQWNLRKKAHREERDEWIKFHRASKDEKILLQKPEDLDAAMAMVDNLWDHPRVRELMDIPGENEVSVYAEHESGLLVKVRPDRASFGAGLLVDLKTTRDASQSGFIRLAAQHGYHTSFAMYLDVCRVHYPQIDNFFCVCVENTPPYPVNVFLADNALFLDPGRHRWNRAAHLWKKCEDAGEWPGYSQELSIMTLPQWELKKEETET